MSKYEEIFELLTKYRELPNYQLERRVDIFFALYMKDIIENHFNCKIPDDYFNVIPEFPTLTDKGYQISQSEPDDYRANYIDYVLFCKKCKKIYLVELKTDEKSFDLEQLKAMINYSNTELLLKSAQKIIDNALSGIEEPNNSKSRKVKKYLELNQLIIKSISVDTEMGVTYKKPSDINENMNYSNTAQICFIGPDGLKNKADEVIEKARTKNNISAYEEAVIKKIEWISFTNISKYLMKMNDDLSREFGKTLNEWNLPPNTIQGPIIKVGELPIPPEKYAKEILNNHNPLFNEIPGMGIMPQMSMEERYFINGLLAYYKPKNILEIGVNFGEGSAQILHYMRNVPDAKLVSVDISEYAVYTEIINKQTGEKRIYTSDEQVGSFALKHPQHLPLDRWTLIKGKDPSEVLDNLNINFDFLVLDSAHAHPVESLNFLCALPYLNDGAVVVLHDITLFTYHRPPRYFATGVLFSCVSAERIQIESGLSNIGAFQVTSDTRKYVNNVLQALMLPWEPNPCEMRILPIREHLSKHYSQNEIDIFDKAWLSNDWFFSTDDTPWHLPWVWFDNQLLRFLIAQLSVPQVIFYGAGYVLKSFIQYCEKIGFDFTAQIWDIAADSIKEVCGHNVSLPDTKSFGDGKTLVITIKDANICKDIRKQFESIGYNVVSYYDNQEAVVC